jgi:FMN-dependent NADH-azoreductase
MSNILFVSSSARRTASYSNQVAFALLEKLEDAAPRAEVTVRDLARDPLPHIDEDFVTATRGPDGPQTDAQKAIAARSDALVDELIAADTVVIAAPMINFTIPSTLKTWIDYIARAGRTFSYSESGPKGLVTGKRVFLVVARGGIYSGDKRQFDFQLPYLLHVLAFLGMTDVEVIEVEGTAFGPQAAERAVAAALAAVGTATLERRAA